MKGCAGGIPVKKERARDDTELFQNVINNLLSVSYLTLQKHDGNRLLSASLRE